MSAVLDLELSLPGLWVVEEAGDGISLFPSLEGSFLTPAFRMSSCWDSEQSQVVLFGSYPRPSLPRPGPPHQTLGVCQACFLGICWCQGPLPRQPDVPLAAVSRSGLAELGGRRGKRGPGVTGADCLSLVLAQTPFPERICTSPHISKAQRGWREETGAFTLTTLQPSCVQEAGIRQ